MAESPLSQLEPAKRSQLLQACSTAECHLLLGAGASTDSTAADAQPIPGASDLARDLEREFSLSPSDRDLREVASRIVRRHGEVPLYDYFHQRFAGCRPASWYEHLVALAWRRVWTLNVDDVIERAYSSGWPRQQNIAAYSWDDAFVEDDRLLQVVHLHGHVHTAEPSRLVFALIEYVEAAAAGRAWHTIFGDLWLESPFIVVGAGLRDEVDLARFFEHRNKLRRQLGLYVVDRVDPDWREDLELWGLTVVEAPAATFFTALRAEVEPLQKRRLQLQAGGPKHHASLVHFGQQFRQVQDIHEERRRKNHDILLGDYPLFQDIADDRDVRFEVTTELFDAASSMLDSGSSGTLMLLGPPFSGKSVSLLRLANDLAIQGRSAFWFRGESRLNARLAAEAIALIGGPVVLVVDDIAPWAVSFADVLTELGRTGTQAVVVASARDARLPFLVSSLPQSAWDTDDVYRTRPLSKEDARALSTALDSAGMLNQLQRMPQNRRVALIRDVGVFESLYRAQRGPRFRERVAELYDSTLGPQERRLAFVAAMVSEANMGVPLSVAWGLVPDIRRVEDDSALHDVFDIDVDQVRLRQRAIGLDFLKRSLGRQEMRSTLSMVLHSLRKSVNEVTIRSGSVHAEMSKYILRARNLHGLVGREQTDLLLVEMEGVYGWDGGYWEQRAIFARLNSRWREAEGFAEKAAAMLDDDHRNTTLGTTLMARAASDSRLSPEHVVALLDRGITAFERATTRRETNPVPVLQCLAGLRHILATRGSALADPDIVRLQALWSTWFVRGESLEAFGIWELADELKAERVSWEAEIAAFTR